MTINPLLNLVSATLAQQSVAASVRSTGPVTDPLKILPPTTDDVSATIASTLPVTDPLKILPPTKGDSAPPQPVLQTASLLSASTNFAQISSLLEVAQSGTQQIGSILEQLQSLAQQAHSSGDASGSIDSSFEALLSQIDPVVKNTSFDGASLLNGAFSAPTDGSAAVPDAQTQPLLSLPDLSLQGLFGSNPPSLDGGESVATALSVLSGAQAKTDATSSSIADILGQVNFASASVSTALANSAAAFSILGESDFTGNDTNAALLGDASTAIRAQAGNLAPSLLGLLQE